MPSKLLGAGNRKMSVVNTVSALSELNIRWLAIVAQEQNYGQLDLSLNIGSTL